MKAAVIREYGDASVFRIEDVADPVPKSGEVVVAVRAASVNRRDRGIRAGSLVPRAIGGQSEQQPTFPLILGSDGAGVVAELGDGVDSVAVGDEVVINPSLNWGESNESPGPDWETLGVPRQGTYAERIAVPAAFVAAKPERLTWAEAASIPLAGLTAWRAVVTKGGVVAGERVLVPGVGSGVATFVVQFAHAFGCEVVVTSSSDEKLARARTIGAVGGLLYTAAGWPGRLQLGDRNRPAPGSQGPRIRHAGAPAARQVPVRAHPGAPDPGGHRGGQHPGAAGPGEGRVHQGGRAARHRLAGRCLAGRRDLQHPPH